MTLNNYCVTELESTWLTETNTGITVVQVAHVGSDFHYLKRA